MLRTILVVDDSEVVQHICAGFLSRYYGTRLVTAMDGAEALKCVSREPEIDLILLDLNLPVVNGLEVLEQLSGNVSYRRIPVVVVTSRSREMDIERCLAAGARGYLMKPFDAQELHRVIESATGERPSDAPRASPTPRVAVVQKLCR
jgi:CheY-like chemotaxis protein